jgi:uncharacterized membrane protein HdeD (DUF308 family)
MSKESSPQASHSEEIPKAGLSAVTNDSGRSLVGVGIVLSILGLLAIVFPFVTGLSLSILLGVLLVVGGFLHVANAFSAPGWTGSIVQVVLAVVYVIAGIALLANPTVGLVTLTLLVLAYFVVEGVVLIGMGIALRAERNWAWSVLSGGLSLVLAALIWLGLPSSAAWAVGLLFGVNLLSTGVAMVMLGWGNDRTTEEITQSVA